MSGHFKVFMPPVKGGGMEIFMKKRILLMNDLPGYGKVALSSMIPVLSYMGYEVYNLPTALVSNTLDYGKFEILETTDYIKNSICVWAELGFQFDAISTGFIVSEKQAKLISDFCREQSRRGSLIFVDPIMGDAGKLYNGVSEKTIENMKELVSVADYIVPNYTEAAALTSMKYQNDFGEKEKEEMLSRLCQIGAKSVVITSAHMNGTNAVIGYDSRTNENFVLPFEAIPGRFFGTGDIFSAVFIGNMLGEKKLQESVQTAMDVVKMLIGKNQQRNKCKYIPVEQYLEEILCLQR